MIRFTASIHHNYNTILQMCKNRYDTFCFSNKIVMALMGLLLAVLGVWNIQNIVGLIFLMIGCWLLTSLNFPAKASADKIKEAIKGEYPSNRYEFYDKNFVLYAQQNDTINYDRIYRLVEDEQYCYLYINKEAAYMIEKISLGDQLKDFMAFMKKVTKSEWTQPYKLSTFNLKTIISLIKERTAKK